VIEVICDAGARYVKVAASRDGRRAAVLVAPAQEAVDLEAVAKRVGDTLRPGVFEATRLWSLGDSAGNAPRLAEWMVRLGPVSRLAPMRQLSLGAALMHMAPGNDGELLLADCGAIRTRVFALTPMPGAPPERPPRLHIFENERCTAGSGRLVETMAAALGLGLDEIDASVAAAQAPSRLVTTCPVFVESEVVSLINAGQRREDVMAGVVAYAVDKVAALVQRAAPRGKPLLLFGGLARLGAFRAALAAKLPGHSLLAAPVDPMLLPCLAGLCQVTAAPPGTWPAVDIVPWERRRGD